MPVARYFLWVGSVVLTLLFIADACLPKLSSGRATDQSTPVIRISSDQKWPERIVFDTAAPMPRVANAASSVQVNPAHATADVIPERAREALAQQQTPDDAHMQAKRPKKQEARRQQKIATRHFARSPFWMAHRSQYAWYGNRMWW